MNRVVASSLAVYLLLGAAIPASAAPDSTSDLHCLLAMGALQQPTSDQARKNTGILGSMYFLGKVTAKNPSIDLPARLAGEAEKLRGQSGQDLIARCMQEFETRANQLVSSSEAVQK